MPESSARAAASFIAAKVSAALYGGDYNPEQWDATQGYDGDAVWRDDMRLMRRAGVNAHGQEATRHGPFQ